MPKNESKISVSIFCDRYGVNEYDRITIEKLYANQLKTEQEWHPILNKEFNVPISLQK